jgi:two-component system response regulator TrcR
VNTTTSQVSGSARRQADLGELIRMALRREAKPLDVEELATRLRGLLLRLEHLTPQPDEVLTVGDLELDGASRSVTRAGSSISLTCREFELLRYLMRHPRRAVGRQEILDRVWNYDFGGRSGIVDLYVSYLRKKVDAGRTPMIHTVRGVGYLLRPAE